jgi:iron complex outermembrane receptor protein
MAIEVQSVYGASRREQLVTEAPSAVTIVSAEEIAAFGWRTLDEVLRNVRGFYTTHDRNYSYLGARGFGRPTDYNNRILVLVDGHRLNDSVYDAVGIGADLPIDLDLIARIEVIRGPGSALYGTSAYFGVVNLVTRQGGAVGGAEVSLDTASEGHLRLRASYGRQFGEGRQFLLSASRERSEGAAALYFDDYADEGGWAYDADGEDASRLFGSATWGGLTLQGAVGQRRKDVPTGSYGTTFGDPRNQTLDTRSWIDAGYQRTLAGTVLTGRAFFDRMDYDGVFVYEAGSRINRDFSRGVWFGTELMAARRVGSRHQVTAGAEFRNNRRQDQWNYDLEPAVSWLDDRRRSRQAALFVQDDIALTRRLTAVVGARYDWWRDVGTGRPRLGLVYRPDGDTAVKLLYGEAFRRPSVFELYYEEGTNQANAALEPETLRTTELVIERYVGRRMRLTGTVYTTRLSGLVSQLTDESGEYVWYANHGRVRAVGAEVEAERRWASGVLLRGHVSLQRAEDTDTGLSLTNSPGRLANLSAMVPLSDRRLTFAGVVRYVGMRTTRDDIECPAATLMDATLSYAVTPRLTLRTGARNLFDATLLDPVGGELRQPAIAQDGRQFFLRLSVAF